MASVHVISLLEGIDTSTPIPDRVGATLWSLYLLSHPILLSVSQPSYHLASANTTCCQVLAINDLFRRPLDHLSAPPHYMLGYGDLDLLLWIFSFSSWRSSPFEASFTKMALVGVCWSPDTLLSDALTTAACWLRLNTLQLLGCRLLDPTQYLTAAHGPEVFRVCHWWWHKFGSGACARFGW